MKLFKKILKPSFLIYFPLSFYLDKASESSISESHLTDYESLNIPEIC